MVSATQLAYLFAFRTAALRLRPLFNRKHNATVLNISTSLVPSNRSSMWTWTARSVLLLARSAKVTIRLYSVSPSQDSTPLISPESRPDALRFWLSRIAQQICTQRTLLANAAPWKAKSETLNTEANTPPQTENWSTAISPLAVLNTQSSPDALAAMATSLLQVLRTVSAAHSPGSSAIKDTTASSAT
jgi:hypothetical protein